MMQAILAEISETSKVSILLAADTPARMPDQLASTPHPSGVTIPRPVTTTRRSITLSRKPAA
jgi:hypothetical protein